MKELPKRYIEKRIQNATNNETDFTTGMLSCRSGKSQEQHAREAAKQGFLSFTASYLDRTTLPVWQKGIILADAYFKHAETEEHLKKSSGTDEAASHQEKAQQSRKIAQNLTRAAEKAKNS